MQPTPGEVFIDRMRPLVIPAVIVLAITLLLLRARSDLASTPRFVVDPSVCTVQDRPAWASELLATTLAEQVSRGLGAQASLLEGQDLHRWSATLEQLSPWIESVERIEPRFPYQADVRLRLRRPVMVVDDGILVAPGGHVLGPGPVSVEPPPLAFRGRTEDEDVRECAAAATELLPYREELDRLGVHVVSVGIAVDQTVWFGTDTGVELNWGRTLRKSEYANLDLPHEARIANLREVLVDYPGLRGVRKVQLWTDRPVVTPRSG
ncbi:MAG: hypothetical protein ACYTG2_05880 [Planctomycetota bacterium]|jgi:hypothetical protein